MPIDRPLLHLLIRFALALALSACGAVVATAHAAPLRFDSSTIDAVGAPASIEANRAPFAAKHRAAAPDIQHDEEDLR